jgi:cell division ATPase FtsA
VDNHGRFHVIVDMGQQTTTIALSCGGQLRWARQTALGGGQLTQKVAAKLNLDWDQAEALRWQWREDQADAGCLDQQVERMLDDLARDLVEELADELEECFRQGQASMPAADGGEVIFTGGEARPPLVTLLHERISQPVQVGHALENLDATSGQENPCPSEPQGGWAVTLGLCLLERARAHDEVPV